MISTYQAVLNTKSLSFATEVEVKKITGCLPGAVPPFGSLWNIKTYLDRSLQNEKEIDFNAGLRTDSVHMFEADYESIEKPIVVDVTV
jgi:Ala-tRNA(Pro) deacylase